MFRLTCALAPLLLFAPRAAGGQLPATPTDTAVVLTLVLAGSVRQWTGPIRFVALGTCRAAPTVCRRYGFWHADSARGQALLDSLALFPAPRDSAGRTRAAVFRVGAPRFEGDSAWVNVGQRGGQLGPAGGGFAADWWVLLRRLPGGVGWDVVRWSLARIT